MTTLDEMADRLDPKDAAEIREFRDFLVMRKLAQKYREALEHILRLQDEHDGDFEFVFDLAEKIARDALSRT